ncbi:MAG TPA: hypothetical protein VFK78_12555 [Gemmatimonadales bacterium]|nr:hypothetical protein [Gemmatimonadales bacterium]
MPKSPAAQHLDEVRQGFVGYVHLDGLQWRVMLRLRLEDDVWWRGRLWFTENGGTEVWDKEEMLGRSPEELLRQARGLSPDDLSRRFRASYDERRRYFGLRAMLDDLLEKARGMNRVVMRVAVGEMDSRRAGAELDRLQEEMRGLVDGMRDVAGIEGRR